MEQSAEITSDQIVLMERQLAKIDFFDFDNEPKPDILYLNQQIEVVRNQLFRYWDERTERNGDEERRFYCPYRLLVERDGEKCYLQLTIMIDGKNFEVYGDGFETLSGSNPTAKNSNQVREEALRKLAQVYNIKENLHKRLQASPVTTIPSARDQLFRYWDEGTERNGDEERRFYCPYRLLVERDGEKCYLQLTIMIDGKNFEVYGDGFETLSGSNPTAKNSNQVREEALRKLAQVYKIEENSHKRLQALPVTTIPSVTDQLFRFWDEKTRQNGDEKRIFFCKYQLKNGGKSYLTFTIKIDGNKYEIHGDDFETLSGVSSQALNARRVEAEALQALADVYGIKELNLYNNDNLILLARACSIYKSVEDK